MKLKLRSIVAMILAVLMLFAGTAVLAEGEGDAPAPEVKKEEPKKEEPKKEEAPKEAPKEEPKKEEAPKEEPKKEEAPKEEPKAEAKASEPEKAPEPEKKAEEKVEVFIVEVNNEKENTSTQSVEFDTKEEAEKASNKDGTSETNGEIPIPTEPPADPTAEPTDALETEAPLEEGLTEEELLEEELLEEEEEKNRSVTVSSTLGGSIVMGDSFTLRAKLDGFEGDEYEIYWQYNDGSRWITYSDSNTLSLTIKATIETVNYTWRICVIAKAK